MIPDVSGITNTAIDIAQRTGNAEIIAWVALVCAVVGVVWYYIKKKL